MFDSLLSRIRRLKGRETSNSSERAIEQSFVLPILNDIGWDRDDTEEVYPQYQIDNRKVDYSLRANGHNKVFIEVKKTSEELEKHQQQLLDYAFREGINLAVLTNGIDWWFFLPIKSVQWEKRKFYSINLNSQPEEEIANKFIDFLSKESILTNRAIDLAEKCHNSSLRDSKVKETIPLVWSELIQSRNPELIQLLKEEVKKKTNFLPEIDEIEGFLNSLFGSKQNLLGNPLDVPAKRIQPISVSPPRNTFSEGKGTRAQNTTLKVTINTINGQKQIQERKAIDTLIKTIEFFGIENVKQKTQINSKFPLIINQSEVQLFDRDNVYRKINDSYCIYSNNSTPTKKQYIESVSEQLGYKVMVEILKNS